jgi:hypothetical protein
MSDPSDDEAANPRDQLVSQIAEGDVPKLVALTATMLAKEVLPALDELRGELGGLRWKFNFIEQALAEVVTIYEHLQELVPASKSAELAQERARLQAKLEKVTKKWERADLEPCPCVGRGMIRLRLSLPRFPPLPAASEQFSLAAPQ